MVRLQQATKEGRSVNLQYALETLKVELERLHADELRAIRAGRTKATAQLSWKGEGIRYAIDVLEAALGDSK